ncbi:MAG TPA: pilus assembly protein N-terminal domain-containing protein [Methylibium sp.]|uniref:type II and III secretion system protein family protein n=1 Tax=Methylibium sp. TaxID=2067992 RepID=UPI002DBFE65D|nr:pilus assembly protein N-terminal domain-containing protein [Methylibium sp.]HEU4458266.1 pilus assembly protein N-terminal domain-containing protein [Methylibium sp.]
MFISAFDFSPRRSPSRASLCGGVQVASRLSWVATLLLVLTTSNVSAQTSTPVPTPSIASAPVSAATSAATPALKPPSALVSAAVASRTATPARDASPARRVSVPATQVIDIGPASLTDITLFVGESRLLSGLKSARVVVGSGTVATASVLESREVMLFGNAPGTVTLQVWDVLGQLRQYRLTVRPAEMQRLAAELGELLRDVPNLRITPVGDKVVIDGHDLGDENLYKIATLTKTYEQVVNLTEYQKDHGGWDRMVLLDVKIVEFKNKDRLRELGIQWDAQANGPAFGIAGDIRSSYQSDGNRFYVLPGGGGLPVEGADRLARPVTPFRSYFGLLSVLYSRINLLANDGDAVVLASPQLTARSGKQARMNVGGRVPIVVVGGLGDRTVETLTYGVGLSVTPWVGRNGSIHASISTEVSEPDGSVTINGQPAFRERRVETVFNVRDGQTMVLSGLIQRNKSTTVTKVPLLGDVPLLGALFRSTREAESESEVVIFVTPTIVDADSDSVRQRIAESEARAGRYLGAPARVGLEPVPASPAPAPTAQELAQ